MIAAGNLPRLHEKTEQRPKTAQRPHKYPEVKALTKRDCQDGTRIYLGGLRSCLPSIHKTHVLLGSAIRNLSLARQLSIQHTQ